MFVYVALCLGSREAQLPQLSTLALAPKSDGPLLSGCPWTPCSPAHYSMGPRALQRIYYTHREHSDPTSPHLPLSTSFPSTLFTPSTLHASPFTLSQFYLSLCQTLPFHFYCGLLFINAAFPLSLLHGPLFLVGRVHRESKNTSSCVFLFFVVLKGEKSVSTSICNSQSTKTESFCLSLSYKY